MPYSPNARWEPLFKKAVAYLTRFEIGPGQWAIGGGTMLAEMFHRRASRDIDIFLLGDGFRRVAMGSHLIEADCLALDMGDNYLKADFDGLGEMDFISLGAQEGFSITRFKPIPKVLFGVPALVDHPLDILSKKICLRGGNFQPRDAFDLADIFSHWPNREEFATIARSNFFQLKFGAFKAGLERLFSSPTYEADMAALEVLPDGLEIRGREKGLCLEAVAFLQAAIDGRGRAAPPAVARTAATAAATGTDKRRVITLVRKTANVFRIIETPPNATEGESNGNHDN